MIKRYFRNCLKDKSKLISLLTFLLIVLSILPFTNSVVFAVCGTNITVDGCPYIDRGGAGVFCAAPLPANSTTCLTGYDCIHPGADYCCKPKEETCNQIECATQGCNRKVGGTCATQPDKPKPKTIDGSLCCCAPDCTAGKGCPTGGGNGSTKPPTGCVAPNINSTAADPDAIYCCCPPVPTPTPVPCACVKHLTDPTKLCISCNPSGTCPFLKTCTFKDSVPAGNGSCNCCPDAGIPACAPTPTPTPAPCACVKHLTDPTKLCVSCVPSGACPTGKTCTFKDSVPAGNGSCNCCPDAGIPACSTPTPTPTPAINCATAAAPACSGTGCVLPQVCKGRTSCACVDLCENSNAMACGGFCQDSSLICILYGGSCSCRPNPSPPPATATTTTDTSTAPTTTDTSSTTTTDTATADAGAYVDPSTTTTDTATADTTTYADPTTAFAARENEPKCGSLKHPACSTGKCKDPDKVCVSKFNKKKNKMVCKCKKEGDNADSDEEDDDE